MLSIFGVSIVLYFIKTLSGSRNLYADDTNLTYADHDPDKLISVLNDDLKTLQN